MDSSNPAGKLNVFFSRGLHEWLASNLQNELRMQFEGVDWQCLFEIVAWCFWKNPNLFVFYGITWGVKELIKVFLQL